MATARKPDGRSSTTFQSSALKNMNMVTSNNKGSERARSRPTDRNWDTSCFSAQIMVGTTP